MQNRFRVALVDIVIDHIQHTRLVGKKSVQGARRVGSGLLKQPLLHVQVNNLVQLRDCLGRPVVMLHQRFAGTSGVALLTLRRRQPKVLRHRGLQIEHQAVFTPLGNVVQAPTNQGQQVFVALQLA